MLKLSIVIPIYNSEKNIGDCVNSILGQSFNEYEVILVNDGSTDQSEEICKSLAIRDSRIKVINQSNQGVSAARNNGIKLSTGEYLMFVDSDDILPNEIISNLFKEGNNADFIMSGYSEFIDQPDNIIKQYVCPSLDGDIIELCMSIKSYIDPPFLLGPCFKLFKKELIMKMNNWFPLKMSYGEDAVFVINYLHEVKSVRCIDINGYLYRKDNVKSLSSRFREDKFDINIMISKQIEQLVKMKQKDNADSIFSWNCIRFFDSFTTELMTSELTYDNKKKIFYEKAKQYSVVNEYNMNKNLSWIQEIRKRSINSTFYFGIMYALYQLIKVQRK